jgi:hypothetical protein
MTNKSIFLKTVAAIAACFAVMNLFTGCVPEDESALSDKQIIAFSFAVPPAVGVIDQQAKTIAVAVPAGTDVTALTPAIIISAGATVSPASGVANNFTSPMPYAVTAEDSSVAVYAVTVTVGAGGDPTQPNGTPQELSSPIGTNTTLVDRGIAVDYVFNGSGLLQVNNNATLTIEPGVTVQFTKSGGGINVTSGATIKAIGMASNHIQLVGGASKGSWYGIEIYSTTDNELTYVDFINGGSSTTYSTVWMDNNTKLSMSHCTIDGSKSYGFLADPGAIIPLFNYNTITNCDKAPVSLGSLYSTVEANAFDNTNIYTANNGTEGNYIEVGGDEVKANLTVKNIGQDVDYAFTGSTFVRATTNSNFTVQPGVTIKFTKTGGGIYIANTACIRMQGTASERIRLIGGASKGSWERLEIYSYADNIIEYTDFVNGGSSTSYGVVWVDNNTKVSMNNCLIDGSKAYGIFSDPDAEIPSFGNNTIRNCDKAPIWFGSLSSAAALDATSLLTGNTNDYVETGIDAVDANLTIKPTTVPYYVSTSLYINAQLTINAGATFWMGNDKGFSVRTPNGRLNVAGTAAQHVTFTRPTGTSYYWDGIEFYTLGNTFDYVDFEYGGNTAEGTIWIDNNLPVALSNSSIKNSRYWGITMDAGSSVSCIDVTFSSNASGHVKLPSGLPATGITDGLAFTGTLR